MESVNKRIRRQVRVALAERDWNQARLAKELKKAPQYISDLLTGRVGRIPAGWEQVLDKLDLELVAIPKKKDRQ